jgi:beta-glucosidase
MTNQRKIIHGVRTLCALGLAMACANVLFSSFGDTLSTYLGSNGGSVSGSGSSSYDLKTIIAEGREMDMKLEREGCVLLRNENNTLPLAVGSKVTILGAQSYNYINGGTGSAGGRYDEHTYTMKEAFDGSKSDGDYATSTKKYLDVNSKAWNWLQTACGGSRNTSTTGEYMGHDGKGNLSTFNGTGIDNKDGVGNGDWGGYKRVCEFARSIYDNHYSGDIAEEGYNDTAIVTFARSGAEGASPVMDYDGDGKPSTGTTYLQLSQDEKDLLKFCKEHYSKTVVLINSSAAIELGEVEKEEYGVGAVLWIGHPGEAGLIGVAQILTGEDEKGNAISPSGRLVDTYSYDMSTMPAFYNNDDNKYANVTDKVVGGYGKGTSFGYYQYEEGIYVGYRFYETADAAGLFNTNFWKTHAWKNGVETAGYSSVVQYPFGYGLSYSSFAEKIVASDAPLSAHGTNSVTVNVTNTGSTASKQVVELYMQAPYAVDTTCGISGVGLQKSHKVLMGFGKTSLLQAGANEDVTITFDTDDLASFDTYGHGCYVLEKGDYQFHVGKNAHEDACDPLKVNLGSSYYYDEEGVGKRSCDKMVAKVAMGDVDAGDGNMLDGYLSRSDFETGLNSIMSHESSCKTENLSDVAVNALTCPAMGSVDYPYSTYVNGQKVTKTIKKYVGAASYLAYSAEANWEGKTQDDDRYIFDDANDDHLIDYGTKYYVEVDGSGKAKKDEYGKYMVTTEATSMPLDVNCPILKSADYSDEIWAYMLDQLTLKEEISTAASMGWQTPAVDSVGKARISVVDGPGEAGNGQSNYPGCTWFTSAVVNASTWNPYLLEELGHVYAHQSIHNGLGGAYAPAMNTHRTPFGGRNFEYFSEDGFIGGKMGSAEVTGLQAEGIVVYVKHMAMNDNDTNRDGNITWFAEQAAREIMLKDYEICVHEIFVKDTAKENGKFVKGEGALGIMASLNRDGISQFHQGLYKNILRGEWGFNGMIITDGIGPSPWMMTPGVGLFGGVEGQLGGSDISTYESVEGNATTTFYGRYLLRQAAKHMLYQNCHAAQIASTPNTSWKAYWVATNVVLGLGIGAAALFLVALPLVKVLKNKDDEGKEAK